MGKARGEPPRPSTRCGPGHELRASRELATPPHTKAALVAAKSPTLSHVQAAAIGLAGLTALVSVDDTLQLRAGETIFIHGGAGGVGGIAVSLAWSIGAKVIASASSVNHEYVRGLGADIVVDYRHDDFSAFSGACDAVFDTAGPEAIARSFNLLRPGGRIASVGVAEGPELPRPDIEFRRPRVTRDRQHLDRLTALVISGAVKLPDITTYRLADAAAAHRVSEGRHLRGKLVLEVREG